MIIFNHTICQVKILYLIAKQRNKQIKQQQNKTKEGLHLSGFHRTLLVEPAWSPVDCPRFNLRIEK